MSPIMHLFGCCFHLLLRGFGVLYNTLKRFVVPSVGGATRFSNLWQKFSKTQKKSAAELCQILRIVTIYTVINSTHVHVQQHMLVTISCWFCITFEVMHLFLVLLSIISCKSQLCLKVWPIHRCFLCQIVLYFLSLFILLRTSSLVLYQAS